MNNRVDSLQRFLQRETIHQVCCPHQYPFRKSGAAITHHRDHLFSLFQEFVNEVSTQQSRCAGDCNHASK